jgi:hypothetical protein
MSRFRDFEDKKDEPGIVRGMQVGGAFECQHCPLVSTVGFINHVEEKLYWECEDGHVNSIHFKS